MKHGANIYKYAKQIMCQPEDIIDFSSNINVHQPQNFLRIPSTVVSKYGNSTYKNLKELIAKNYKINHNQIALFNGATSAIYELFRTLKKKNVFLYAPLYGEYEKAALLAKKTIYHIDRINKPQESPKKNSIVVFVNPSTPEGTYYKLDKLLNKWIDLNCTIILDESFLEFEALKSQRKKINAYKKLYIVQSFSKFYSCAGVRIGAIFSHKKNIKNLQTQPWNISSLDEYFLRSRLLDKAFKKKTLALHKRQKKQLKSILEHSKLFDEIRKSDANFILVHSTQGKAIFEFLLNRKLLVRTCGSFKYLTDDWLRFAVKDKASHKKLQKALKAFND